jgi:adenine C2-methylase RlmN of 23S rRNA A2503 and tRNA A37
MDSAVNEYLKRLDITGLPKQIYEKGPALFGTGFFTSKLVSESTSGDGTTTKLLIELQDGLRVEVCTIPNHFREWNVTMLPRGSF